MASLGNTRRYLDAVDSAVVRDDAALGRVRTLARVLDRYMLDPILGLVIPGAGDIVGSLLGMYVVVIAARRKVSPVIIARMLLNLAGDAVLGFIPLLGDIFDFGFKAHSRNVKLLEQAAQHHGKATARDWAMVVGAALTFLVVLGLLAWGMIALFRAVF